MALTSAQNATLKAYILADPTLNAYPNTSDGNTNMGSERLNVIFSPDYVVWRTNVPLIEVGDGFNGDDVAGLTTANTSRLTAMADYSTTGQDARINASLPDRRQFFDDIFSGAGGATTRANLAIIWRRLATEGEQVFAVGVGSDVDPATLDFEGPLSYQDIQGARNS